MKLLRDESGYVLVLGRPQLAVVGRTEEKEQAIRPPKAVPAPPMISCAQPHCCFYCCWCGESILLPNDRIGSPFGNPDARKIDVRSIATVCFQCRHIGNYSMFRGCRGFDTRHKVALAISTGATQLLNWLQCTEKTCTARVPLFLRREEDSAPEQLQASEWLWDELTCAYGHRIRPIPLDPTLSLPLRTYGKLG